MTDTELGKMGIISDRTKLHPHRYWCNTTKTEFRITEEISAEDIMIMIFQDGYTKGIETGKAQRSNDFKNLINND
jgi:hypothetical protein